MNTTKLLAAVIVVGLQAGLAENSLAQDSAQQDEVVEEIITLGTRTKGRTALETTAPVDVFNAEALAKAPSADLNDALRTLVPSFSVNRQPVNDGGTFVRPAKLRGLPADKTLVLVNGKRRHRSALVTLANEGVRGSQAPDLATIPVAAVQTIEVLRDGAGAQYGSDAIAGVLNFRLKDASEGGSLRVRSGSTFEGDGDSIIVSGNIGLPLGDNGFISLTGEFTESDSTSRGEQTSAAVAFAADPANAAFAAAADFSRPLQEYGAPNSDAIRFFVNAGVDVSDSMSWYGFASLSDSGGDGDFYYRSPGGAGGVGNSLFTDISDGAGGIANFSNVFPAGFTPRFFGELQDLGLTTGLRGETGKLGWDVSGQYGSSEIEYSINNTVNPSLGESSPTSFNVGSLEQTEFALNADFSYAVPVASFDSGELNVAFGAEYRDEEYSIGAGELASYQVGPFQAPVGSNGFPGYSPDQAVTTSRSSYAVYLDLEADVTDRLLLNGAIRFEDFDDFGSSFNGKIAARFSATDNLNLRASFGTGFHAPSPGQQGTLNVRTTVESGVAASAGLYPASTAVAQFYGAVALEPEDATNYAAGFAWTPLDNLTLTIDYYRIELDDRIGLSSSFAVSDADRLTLASLGVVNAATLGAVSYFTNDFDTETTGIDAVATYDTDNALGSLQLQASFNWGETKVTSRNNRQNANGDPIDTVNDEQVFDIRNIIPETRLIIGAQQFIGDKWSVFVRASRWGDWANACCGNGPSIQEYDAQWLLDLDVSYQITDNLAINVGANNLFDEFPDRDTVEFGGFTGQVYDLEAPFGFDGGSYYLQLGYDF